MSRTVHVLYEDDVCQIALGAFLAEPSALRCARLWVASRRAAGFTASANRAAWDFARGYETFPWWLVRVPILDGEGAA